MGGSDGIEARWIGIAEQLVGTVGGTVIVGVDGTDASTNALAYAVGVARRQHARLMLVHVAPFDGYSYDPTGRAWAAMPAEHDTSWLRELVRRLESEVDVPVQLAVCQGDPCDRLLEQARQEWADLIIVGQSHSVAHRLLGAVGRKLTRRAPVPVTVVP